ncbi:conserved hypothetical protein [Trichinella spiralis]|uniref:hypothetical protein n=1 Tax=Trichinella spiralis TaxID=6334 RepID=UPI0001EFB5CE|nr:conserved hypothetical protein [Trichinella spiralis]
MTCIISSCVTSTLLFFQDTSVTAAMKLRNEQPSSLTVDSGRNFYVVKSAKLFEVLKTHVYISHNGLFMAHAAVSKVHRNCSSNSTHQSIAISWAGHRLSQLLQTPLATAA